MEPLNLLLPDFKARSAGIMKAYRERYSFLRHELPGGPVVSVFSMALAIHGCIGLHLARVELILMLRALAARVASVEAAGPDWIQFPHLSPMILAPQSMHMEMQPA